MNNTDQHAVLVECANINCSRTDTPDNMTADEDGDLWCGDCAPVDADLADATAPASEPSDKRYVTIQVPATVYLTVTIDAEGSPTGFDRSVVMANEGDAGYFGPTMSVWDSDLVGADEYETELITEEALTYVNETTPWPRPTWEG